MIKKIFNIKMYKTKMKQAIIINKKMKMMMKIKIIKTKMKKKIRKIINKLMIKRLIIH